MNYVSLSLVYVEELGLRDLLRRIYFSIARAVKSLLLDSGLSVYARSLLLIATNLYGLLSHTMLIVARQAISSTESPTASTTS